MTKILLTGATGFIGRHVLHSLMEYDGYEIVCTARKPRPDNFMGCRYIAYDIGRASEEPASVFGRPDILIHLSWEGLPNYNQMFHIEKNLMNNYTFIKKLVEAGTKNIVVTGTCYEYGMKNGKLLESDGCSPVTAYGIAKDALRRFLEHLQIEMHFEMKWLRLFFTYGEGQSTNSLFPQLKRAIDSGIGVFDMSDGQQLRDYLAVEELSDMIVRVSLQNRVKGVINICSGKPISVRTLVENYLKDKGKGLKLRLGVLSHPIYEPMAFWGDNQKLCDALAAFDEEFPVLRPETGSSAEGY